MAINTPSQDRCGNKRVRKLWCEKVASTHGLVVRRGVMFGEVVGQIVSPAAPVNDELALVDAIADPVETHVHGFGSALFDSAVRDASSTGVVGLDWCGWLRMAHVVQRGAQHGSLFAVEE